jgi:hypothetical protein
VNPRYLPDTLEGKMDRVVEEAGEILQVIGKAGRFGLKSYHPEGGPNNAALILSEMADLRHALADLEEEISSEARIVLHDLDDRGYYVRTDEVLTTGQLRELLDYEEYESDLDFNADHKVIQVCAGEWHREGFDWRLYKDPEWD